MLYSNLVKQAYAVLKPDDKRVIEASERLQQRLRAIDEKAVRSGSDGFVSGLDADRLELSAAEGGEGSSGGNLFKAQENVSKTLEQVRERADAILAEAKEQAGNILKDAEKQAAAMLSDARSQGYNEGLARGQKQGYSEGSVRAQKEAEAVKREYQDKERQLEDFYQRQIDQLEPQLADAITAVYEHIFHVELGAYREILAHLISDTLRKIEGGHEFMIHVSREDYPYISMQKKEIAAGAVSENCSVEVTEDASLSKNECRIETESGIFDCGLDTQLAELKKKLMLLAWSGKEK